ncbi:MAG: ABC transporter substrate-binding protein [Chloroflexota bacterium]|nr:ABC transporter substrate-binding protein [Chloroflexota bacterium]
MVDRMQLTRRVMMAAGIGAGTMTVTPHWLTGPAAAQDVATPCAGQTGGRLTVGQIQDLTSFDPFMLLFVNYVIQHQLFDRLLTMDHELVVSPSLAEGWDIAEDGRSIAFHLRPGVTFHNGRPLEAADIVANIERAQNEETGGNIFAKVQTIAMAEATDPSRVVVTFTEPTPNMFDIFDSLSIIAPESFDDVQRAPIGTGPFRFQEWIPGEQVVMVRNEDYWREGLPYLDEIVVTPYADGETLTLALESGQIDVGISLPYTNAQRLEESAEVVVERGQEGALLYVLVINPPDASQPETPLSNNLVRQAINYALNRQVIVDQALFGVGQASVVAFPEFSLAYFPEMTDQYAFDLDRARELLAEAGYADGFEMEILAPTSFPELSSMGQLLAADLAQIGINATITPMESAVWTPRLLAGDYQATFTFIGRSHKDPLGLFDNSPFRVSNSPVWPEEDFPEGYAEAILAAGTSVDPEERAESFRTLNEIMLEQSAQIPISWKYTLFGWGNDVHGVDWSPDDEIKLAAAWIGEC